MQVLTAKDIMNPNVFSVREDLTTHELAAFFTDKMISGAPVLSHSGQLIGVVSLSDIVRNDSQRVRMVTNKVQSETSLHGWEGKANQDEIEELHIETDDSLTVRDIMTPIVFEVGEQVSVTEMADLMIEGRIHRLFVTRDAQLVGIVTALDMMKVLRNMLDEPNRLY